MHMLAPTGLSFSMGRYCLGNAMLFVFCKLLPQLILAQPFVERRFDVDTVGTFVYRNAVGFNGVNLSLSLRVWRPIDASRKPKPLMVMIHGGGFIDGNINGMEPFCRDWARRGYVTASIEYRLGMVGSPLLDPPWVYDKQEPVRAVWRAVQDLRYAITYLLGMSSVFEIDAANYFVLGASAGGITALHHAFLDPSDSIPMAILNVGPANRLSGQVERPSILDSSDTVAFAAPRAVVSYFGGTMLPSHLGGAEMPATFLYHQREDPVVGCGIQKGLWRVPLPGVADNWPLLHGSCALQDALRDSGLPPEKFNVMIHNGAGHELHNYFFVDSMAALFCSRFLSLPSSVPTPSNPTPSTWMVSTLHGTIVARGTGTEREFLDELQQLRTPGYLLGTYGVDMVIIYDGIIIGRRNQRSIRSTISRHFQWEQ